MIFLCGIFSIINIITSATLVFMILLKNRQLKNYLMFNVAIGLFSLFYTFQFFIKDPAAVLITSRLTMLFVIFITYFYSLAIADLVGFKVSKWFHVPNTLVAVAFSLSSFTALNVSHVDLLFNGYYWPVAGPALIFYIALYSLNALLGLGILFSRFKTDIKARYLTIATFIGFFGGTPNFIPFYQIEIPPFLNILVSIYIIIVFYAMTKHHLLDISIVISKTLSNAITILIFGTVYFILFLLHKSFISTQLNVIFLFWSLLYGTAVGFYFLPLRQFLQTTTDKLFLKFRYNYEAVLLRFTSALAEAASLADIMRIVPTILSEEIEIAQVKMFLPHHYGEPDQSIEVYELWNLENNKPDPFITLKQGDAIYDTIMAKRAVCFAKEAPAELKDYVKKEAIEVCVPCTRGGIVECIIFLGPKRTEEPYNQNDDNLFQTVSVQIATALNRIKPFELVKRDYQRSLETAEKAAQQVSFANLTRGIAHEIRNPLGMMRSAAEVVQEYLDNPEEIKEFANAVIENADRLAKMTETMLKYGKHQTKSDSKVSVNAIIEDILLLGKTMLKKEQIDVVMQCGDVPEINGDRDQLNQAFLNIILNATQAMHETPLKKLTLSTRLSSFHNKAGKEVMGIELAVMDTGTGIKPEHMKQIFDPFFTTKYEGTGLGLSTVMRIIDEHGGLADVASEIGKGTTFKLYLPV